MLPPLASHIAFNPLLPPGRDQLNQRMPIGAIGKVIAIFSTPWWRDQGLDGAGISDTGAVRVTYDSSPANASFGALIGLIEADDMRKLDSASNIEIKRQAKQSFKNFFGPRVEQQRIFLYNDGIRKNSPEVQVHICRLVY